MNSSLSCKNYHWPFPNKLGRIGLGITFKMFMLGWGCLSLLIWTFLKFNIYYMLIMLEKDKVKLSIKKVTERQTYWMLRLSDKQTYRSTSYAIRDLCILTPTLIRSLMTKWHGSGSNSTISCSEISMWLCCPVAWQRSNVLLISGI